MSANHSHRNPVRYMTVGSKTASDDSLCSQLKFAILSLTATMDKRIVFSVCLLIYYVIELSVLSVISQQMFLKVVVSLMMIATCLTLTRICMGDYDKAKVVVVINGCLFGLTLGWMCYAATAIDIDAGLSVFFALNGVAIAVTAFLDIRMQQSYVCHDAISADRINEYPAHGNGAASRDNGASNGVSSEKTVSTHDIAYHNTAQGYNFSRDVENNGDFDFSSSQGPSDAPSDSMMQISGDDDVFDGFRVRLEKLPLSNPGIPSDVPWESFSYLEHRVDSSSCHIYSAFWRGTAVIIKLIKADRVASAMAVAEFATEASILSRLDHPHIVKLLGSGTHPRRFLILELLDGGSLSHSLGLRAGANNRMTKRKFSYLETLMLARSLASALDYLHNKWHSSIHVIHRDLKPDNIGFTADGKLKLFDFGLCACVRTHGDRRDQYRLTGNTGTLRYMAPEVALGRQYNCSVDVYSFGVIVWQVLRSKVPFRDMGKKAYIQEVVVGGKRPPLDRRWPVGFSALLQRCWHEDKDQRPSLSEVVAELDVLIEEASGLGSVSITMQVNHKLRRMKSYASKNMVRFLPMLAAVGFIFLVASIAILLLGGRTSGSSLAVVSCTALYLGGMSYVKGDTKSDQLQEQKVGFGLGARAQSIIQIFGRGRRRAPSQSMQELKSRVSDPHALSSSAASGACAGSCLNVEDPVSFNPLSPHSIHHSSDGDAVEGYYGRGDNMEEGKEIGRPVHQASM